MNDLDRKIAELKGASLMPDGPYVGGITPDRSKYVAPTWSTSDSNALELVDELTRPEQNRMTEFAFAMRTAEVGRGWLAIFFPGQGRDHFPGGGYTRPEAICRAYIAAREWMAAKDAWRKGEEAKDKAMRSELGL